MQGVDLLYRSYQHCKCLQVLCSTTADYSRLVQMALVLLMQFQQQAEAHIYLIIPRWCKYDLAQNKFNYLVVFGWYRTNPTSPGWLLHISMYIFWPITCIIFSFINFHSIPVLELSGCEPMITSDAHIHLIFLVGIDFSGSKPVQLVRAKSSMFPCNYFHQ